MVTNTQMRQNREQSKLESGNHIVITVVLTVPRVFYACCEIQQLHSASLSFNIITPSFCSLAFPHAVPTRITEKSPSVTHCDGDVAGRVREHGRLAIDPAARNVVSAVAYKFLVCRLRFRGARYRGCVRRHSTAILAYRRPPYFLTIISQNSFYKVIMRICIEFLAALLLRPLGSWRITGRSKPSKASLSSQRLYYILSLSKYSVCSPQLLLRYPSTAVSVNGQESDKVH